MAYFDETGGVWRRRFVVSGFSLIVLLAAACSAPEPARSDHDTKPDMAAASLIVINGDVRTVDPDVPHASAFAVRDGRFLAIGEDEDIGVLAGAETRIIDAQGATVLPGLTDGHSHLSFGLPLVRGVDLYGNTDKQAWLNLIAAKADTLPAGAWILGGRWDHSLVGGDLPTKEELDAVVPDHPVFLADVDAHSAWVNSRALELAGITSTTLAPTGGALVLDPETGEPSGILLETAQNLVRDSEAFIEATALDADARIDTLAETIAFANSLGITSAHDMAGIGPFSDYETLLADDRLTLRIWYGFHGLGNTAPDEAVYAELRRIKSGSAAIEPATQDGPMLVPGYVKLLIDGVLSSHTAVLLEPYSDRPHETGLPLMTQDHASAHVRTANAAGFPVAIHAIGDGAVRRALDIFDHGGAKPALPNRIEHIEILHPDDLGRFAAENVVASVNPHHAVTTFDNYLTDRIGAAREGFAYPYGALQNTGADLVLGSDWPTAPLAPLTQIWAAVFRQSALERSDDIWHPENALSFEDALYGYTQAGANAAGWGEELGSITVGKWADFVILDATIKTPVQPEIRDMRVRATFISGNNVYQKQ